MDKAEKLKLAGQIVEACLNDKPVDVAELVDKLLVEKCSKMVAKSKKKLAKKMFKEEGEEDSSSEDENGEVEEVEIEEEVEVLEEGKKHKKKKKAKMWISKAIKHPGGLHRALGVPEGKKIPASKINAASHAGGHLGKMANLAKTLKHMHGEDLESDYDDFEIIAEEFDMTPQEEFTEEYLNEMFADTPGREATRMPAMHKKLTKRGWENSGGKGGVGQHYANKDYPGHTFVTHPKGYMHVTPTGKTYHGHDLSNFKHRLKGLKKPAASTGE